MRGASDRLRRRAWKLLLYVTLLAVAVMQLFPLIWVASYSLQKSGDLFGPELLRLPLPPQWDNCVRAFRDGKVLQYSLNSLVVVTVSTALSTVLAFRLGYALTRLQWRLRGVVLGAITLGMVLPGTPRCCRTSSGSATSA